MFHWFKRSAVSVLCWRFEMENAFKIRRTQFGLRMILSKFKCTHNTRHWHFCDPFLIKGRLVPFFSLQETWDTLTQRRKETFFTEPLLPLGDSFQCLTTGRTRISGPTSSCLGPCYWHIIILLSCCFPYPGSRDAFRVSYSPPSLLIYRNSNPRDISMKTNLVLTLANFTLSFQIGKRVTIINWG